MSKPALPANHGFPTTHTLCALLCCAGAIVSLTDWPEVSPQHKSALIPAFLVWGFAVIFQILLAAAHLRTSILDRRHMTRSSNYERSSDMSWALANAAVLLVVAALFWQRSDSPSILAGQTAILSSLLATGGVSLIIWTLRWILTPSSEPAT